MTKALADLWAIVPVKRLHLAKRRLVPVLSPAERISLVQAMLHDVLTALSAAQGLSGIIVVSADPAVAALAKPYGARTVSDTQEAGINAALRQGLDTLEPSASCFIVPADLPLMTVGDIGAVIEKLHQHPIVLAPALSDGGTNVLAMQSRQLIEPCFGENSYINHQARAREKGLSCGIVRSERLGRDIDRPEDLVRWVVPNSNTRTAALLAEIGIAARFAALS